MNPDFEYILWTDEELIKRKFQIKNKKLYDETPTFNAKSDILRYEILHEYGGIYVDADYIQLREFDDFLLDNDMFICYENEICRHDLLCTSTLGAKKEHQFLKNMIHALSNEQRYVKYKHIGWITTGPVLLTQEYKKYK